MGPKRILAAATDWKALLCLGVGSVAAIYFWNPFPVVIGLGFYLWAVQRIAQSPQLQRQAELAVIAEGLAERYQELQKTAMTVNPILPGITVGQGGRSWAVRAHNVNKSAVDVYQQWLQQRDNDPERARLVQEGLRLAVHYYRLLRALADRLQARGASADVKVVSARLERNQKQLEEAQDLEVRRTLLQAIELDTVVLRQAEEERAEVERHLARLTAIESTLEALRQRIFEPELVEDNSRLHELLLEAAAADEAISEVQVRSQVRVR